MRFTITHDFDIPLDALELAVISPALVDRLAPKLAKVGITELRQTSHSLENGVVERHWHYRAKVKLPSFAARSHLAEVCAWDERSVYDLKTHTAAWTVIPSIKPEWQRYVSASGRYHVVSLGEGRTRRVVEGELSLRVRVVGQIAERMIVNEVRKTFDAEAATLNDLATLS